MIKIIDEQDFNDNILKSSRLTLVDFFANWCNPCKNLAPILEEISKENDDFDIVKVDIDKQRDLALDYEIEFIPTIILFQNGKELDRIQGVADKQVILEKVQEFK